MNSTRQRLMDYCSWVVGVRRKFPEMKHGDYRILANLLQALSAEATSEQRYKQVYEILLTWPDE